MQINSLTETPCYKPTPPPFPCLPITKKEHYFMAVTQKDWELPNSWINSIWLAEIDIESRRDFSHLDGHLDR